MRQPKFGGQQKNTARQHRVRGRLQRDEEQGMKIKTIVRTRHVLFKSNRFGLFRRAVESPRRAELRRRMSRKTRRSVQAFILLANASEMEYLSIPQSRGHQTGCCERGTAVVCRCWPPGREKLVQLSFLLLPLSFNPRDD